MHRFNPKPHVKLIGRHIHGFLEEVIGIQGFDSRPAIVRIVGEQFLNELNRIVGHPVRMGKPLLQNLRKFIGQRCFPGSRLKVGPQGAVLTDTGPILGIGVSTGLEDEVKLGCLTVTSLQQTITTEHFGNDTSNAPHINLGGILLAPQKQLNGSVPSGNDAICELLHLAIPTSGEAPIRNLQFTVLANKDIGGFQISVNDIIHVHVMRAFEKLARPGLDVILGEPDFIRLEYPRKVVFMVFKDHVDIPRDTFILSILFLGGNDFLQLDNVLMGQFLQDGNFPNGRDWKPVLLLLGIDALERHNFLRLLIHSHEHAPVYVYVYIIYSVLFVCMFGSGDDERIDGMCVYYRQKDCQYLFEKYSKSIVCSQTFQCNSIDFIVQLVPVLVLVRVQ
jgi:hypothetical protein